MKVLNRKNPISFLILCGTDGVTDEETMNRIKIVNTICVAVGVSILIIGPTISYVLNWKLSVLIPLIVEFAINSTVLIFNYYKKHLTASLVLYFLQVVAIGYFGFSLAHLLHLEFVIVLLIAIIYLIFKEKKIRITALVAALTDLVVLEAFYYYNGRQPAIIVSYDVAFFIHALVVCAIISITMLVSIPYVKGNDLSYDLKKANHIIKIFVAQITHELRTPLNALHQIGQLLEKRIHKGESINESGELIEMSLGASSSMRNIINNVLDMAEIESGRTETYSRESFIVKDFFTKMVEWHRLIAQMDNINIKLSIEGMPVVIVSDPLCLGQITTNLLANAIKYGNKDGTVTLKIRGNDDKWTLQVINQGPGIPAEKLISIFEPYTTSKNSYIEGTGLGLYIVKNKVATLHGVLKVESEPYRNTVFTVTFPLIIGKLKYVSEERGAMEEIPADLHNVNVLLADDHKLSAMVLTDNLQLLGCKVEAVGNGLELLCAAEKHAPDIIILDCHMPVMDGLETVLQLKKNILLRNIPIIIATGDLFSESLEMILSAGADTYVEKPVDIKTLQKIISRLVSQRN